MLTLAKVSLVHTVRIFDIAQILIFLILGKKLSDTKGLAGKGKLMSGGIDAIQSFYGQVIVTAQ